MSATDEDGSKAERSTTPSAFDRTISPIAGRAGQRVAPKVLAIAALLVGCAAVVFATGRFERRTSPEPEQPARQVVAFEPLKPSPTLATPGPNPPQITDGAPRPDASDSPQPLAGAPSVAPAQTTAEQAAARRAERRTAIEAMRSAPILAYTQSAAGTERLSAMPQPPIVPALTLTSTEAASELDQARKTSPINIARATRLPDRNFLIVAGSTIPCTLQTAMDTATPGYVSCTIPSDVYSDNGAVVLMEKGTRVLGEYRASLRQGQRRLFVVWTRAVTPAGVAIALASPAADPLGRAGFDGDVDTHFWDRFGGALLLSIVDDGAYAMASPGAGSTIARLPSDAASIAMQNSINIPPSLRKPQGAHVSIFVAQDFDFSSVYGLQAR